MPVPKRRYQTATCEHCGKTFTRGFQARDQMRFCSTPCARKGVVLRNENHPNWKGGISDRKHAERDLLARAVTEIGKCERCGATEHLQGHHKVPRSVDRSLSMVRSNVVVLCAKCHAAEHPKIAGFVTFPREKHGTEIACVQCGKKFYIKKSAAGNAKYCSRECMRQGETRRCEVCKKEFYAKRKHVVRGQGKFCSLRCFGLSNGARSATARWGFAPVKICETCGKEFKSDYRKARFCSQSCFGVANMKARAATRAA